MNRRLRLGVIGAGSWAVASHEPEPRFDDGGADASHDVVAGGAAGRAGISSVDVVRVNGLYEFTLGARQLGR